jgi:arginyl-tRNA synthetase
MQRFQMLFLAAQAAGWAGDDVSLEHVWFGSVLGEDGSPIKTRQGGVWKLRDLLDEAERRAAAFREDAKADGREAYEFSAQEKAEIARRVGVSAVKYFDLNRDRKKDYVFDWDHILTLKGNTAPAILYAHVRPAKIVRDALEQFPGLDLYAGGGAIRIQHPLERGLALRLARFRETIDAVASELAPHILCNYLYDLTGDANRFYEECPVLKADEATRLSRLRLCDLIARTTRLGLWLLGIETLDRM